MGAKRRHIPRKAMELLAEKQQKGLAPNSITYSASICAGEKAKQQHKAMELLDVMQQEGLAPNSIRYSPAIRACEMGQRPHKAMELL